jgi:hypothetical protein
LKRTLQIAFIAALTVFFLWLFLRNANLREVGQILRRTHFGWIFIGFTVNFLALLLRTVPFREGDPEMPDMLGVTVHEMGRSILRVLVAAEVRIP